MADLTPVGRWVILAKDLISFPMKMELAISRTSAATYELMKPLLVRSHTHSTTCQKSSISYLVIVELKLFMINANLVNICSPQILIQQHFLWKHWNFLKLKTGCCIYVTMVWRLCNRGVTLMWLWHGFCDLFVWNWCEISVTLAWVWFDICVKLVWHWCYIDVSLVLNWCDIGA